METQLCQTDRILIANLTLALNRIADIVAQQEEEPVYSNKEAAALVGRSEDTIARWVTSGKIKKAVRGGRYGIPKSEIKRFIGK